MQFARLGRAVWVSFLLVGCVWCAGCRVDRPASRTPRSHLLSIDFRPDNPKLIDVSLDGELLVTVNQGGEKQDWDPLQRRLKDLSKKAEAGEPAEIKLGVGERVPYEAVCSALLCGAIGGFFCDVRGDKEVELVLWRPASREEWWRQSSRRLDYSKDIMDKGALMNGNPPKENLAIRVDLLGDGTAEGATAGRYTIRVGKSTMEPGELQAALEGLRQKDAAGELPAVLMSPDMAIWHKDVMKACRVARAAGFKRIYFLMPPK